MGWGSIARIGGYAAAPFTGGSSIAVGEALAQVAGNAAKGSADQRGVENDQTLRQNQLLAQLYGTRQNATMNALQGQSSEQMGHANIDLNRRQFALNAPDTRMSQSVRGSILANAKPMTLSGLPDRVASRIPQISGGLTPEMFSAETRELGAEMTRKALIDQLKGDEFTPLERTNFQGGVLASPELEKLQKSGLLEKILGGVALGSSLYSGVGGAMQQRNRRSEDPYAYRTPPYVADEEDM
jgi:hypothetical protein